MKKYRVGIIGLSIGFVVFMVVVVKNYIEERSIENHLFLTVAKIYEYNSPPRGSDRIYYYYYYKGKKYKSVELAGEIVLSKKFLAYYEIKISTENPSYSRIQLDKKVTDTLKIKAAGFSLDDDEKYK